MGLTKKISTATAKAGVNYVRDIVKSTNCIFHEVHQENDFGNDAFIELVDGENVKGITLATQIKSGESFVDQDKCIIPASKKHFQYWLEHSLTVIGIVYDPVEKLAYWSNIKRILKNDRNRVQDGPFTISFPKKETNQFTVEGLRDFFIPLFLNKPILLELERSKLYAASNVPELHSIGISSLMTGFHTSFETWDFYLHLFHDRDVEDIDPRLVYFLAHIPGHPDIWWHKGNNIPQELRSEIKAIMKKFTRNDVLKLLSILGEDDHFERGSLGQNVDALISIIENKAEFLIDIARDKSIPQKDRNKAILLFAYYEQENAITELELIAGEEQPESSYAFDLLKYIQAEGYIYLY